VISIGSASGKDEDEEMLDVVSWLIGIGILVGMGRIDNILQEEGR